MKFYNRHTELEILEKHFRQARQGALLDVIAGRRRVGKTELIRQFIQDKPALYFFVSRKPLPSLLEEWSEVVRRTYPHVGEFLHLEQLLEAVFAMGRKEPLVVVFDEFQNFKYTEPAAFSIFQKLLDTHKRDSRILLIAVGSLTTLMERIFSDAKEPLFGRATRKLTLLPLSLPVIMRILNDFQFISAAARFDIYSVFGGVPKYYVHLEEEELLGSTPFPRVISELFLHPESPLKTEGEDILREEFGKDYQRYFAILSLLASGATKLSEIGNRLKLPVTAVNVYLNNLEKRYGLIERRLPLLAPQQAKAGRYFLRDIFLKFWFRFIYRHLSWIERGAEKEIMKLITRDLTQYQGMIFEDTAREVLVRWSLHQRTTFPFPIREIGRFWDRRGTEEIDVVATGASGQEVFFGECKYNPRRVTSRTIHDLKEKAKLPIFQKFSRQYLGVLTWGPLSHEQQKTIRQTRVIPLNIEEIARGLDE